MQIGDVAGALESCLAIQHAASSFGDSPSLMHCLCRTACTVNSMRAFERVLAQSELSSVSEPLLNLIQENMAKELHESSLLNAMRSERAFQHQMFEDFMAGKITSKDLLYGVGIGPTVETSPTVDAWIIDQVPSVLTRQHVPQLLRSYTELIATLRSDSAGTRGTHRENHIKKKSSRCSGVRSWPDSLLVRAQRNLQKAPILPPLRLRRCRRGTISNRSKPMARICGEPCPCGLPEGRADGPLRW